MQIKQSTIDEFASRGISVRWYPEQTYEEFYKRVWQEEYNSFFNYAKNTCRELNPTGKWVAGFNYETLAEYEESCKELADRHTGWKCRPYDYDKLFIEYDGKTIVKKESIKSKAITPEYIEKLIAKNEKAYSGYYGKFAINMQKLIKQNGLAGKFSIYPTTYGIGVWVFYNWDSEKDIAEVTKILDERGIEYYNEFSDARWVYRFKISKKAANVSKLN